MATKIFYDAEHFRPSPYRVRLYRDGDRYWENQGWWPIGLDWRPGAPMFLSNLALTLMFRRLWAVNKLGTQSRRDQELFQLRVTPVLDEEGREGEPFFFVPTVPIDDENREEYNQWVTAA